MFALEIMSCKLFEISIHEFKFWRKEKGAMVTGLRSVIPTGLRSEIRKKFLPKVALTVCE